MSKFKKNFTTFFLCIAVSLAFHVAMLFGLSNYSGFTFLDRHDEDAISVSLANEDSRIVLPKPGQHVLQKTFAGNTAPLHKEPVNNDPGDGVDGPVTEDNAHEVLPAESAHSALAHQPAAAVPPPAEPARFANYSREVLSYDIYWLGVYAGKAVLEAENNNGIFKITSTVRSAPVISAFYKVEDQAECIVTNGLPFKLRLKLQEGNHATDKETVFDTVNRKVTFINYLKGKKKEYAIPEGTFWDVLSGFYYLRSQILLAGRTTYVNIFDSDKFFRAEVGVLRKETVKVPGMGEISAMVIKPELKSEGLFKKTGDILIWLTDDERKVPLRVETKIPVGNIVAELRGIEIVE